MGADFILHYSCQPKQALGDGDDLAGTMEMVRLLKLGQMARFFEEQARSQGKDPSELSVIRKEVNAGTGEVVERPVTYRDLREQEKRLTVLAPHCEKCPVNVMAESFGCCASMRYPITARSEEWLMARLQPADTPGGYLCCKAVVDLHYDGAVIQSWRDSEHSRLFELPRPLERTLDPDRPEETTINSNQVWHALLGLGSELQPWHCLYVPIWLGAVRIDGEVPARPEQLGELASLASLEERQRRTDFDAGPTDQGPDVFGVQRLLFACYMAWLYEVSLLVDA